MCLVDGDGGGRSVIVVVWPFHSVIARDAREANVVVHGGKNAVTATPPTKTKYLTNSCDNLRSCGGGCLASHHAPSLPNEDQNGSHYQVFPFHQLQIQNHL